MCGGDACLLITKLCVHTCSACTLNGTPPFRARHFPPALPRTQGYQSTGQRPGSITSHNVAVVFAPVTSSNLMMGLMAFASTCTRTKIQSSRSNVDHSNDRTNERMNERTSPTNQRTNQPTNHRPTERTAPSSGSSSARTEHLAPARTRNRQSLPQSGNKECIYCTGVARLPCETSASGAAHGPTEPSARPSRSSITIIVPPTFFGDATTARCKGQGRRRQGGERAEPLQND